VAALTPPQSGFLAYGLKHHGSLVAAKIIANITHPAGSCPLVVLHLPAPAAPHEF
jgi:hypothetical protein